MSSSRSETPEQRPSPTSYEVLPTIEAARPELDSSITRETLSFGTSDQSQSLNAGPGERAGEGPVQDQIRDSDAQCIGTMEFDDIQFDHLDVEFEECFEATQQARLEDPVMNQGLQIERMNPPAQEEHPFPEHEMDDDRDFTFRFEVPQPSPPARLIFDSASRQEYWRPVLLLVSYLNLRYHASHRACNLVLSASKILLKSLGHVRDSDQLQSTLRTVFSSIGLNDPFLILPMCVHCRRIYPQDSPSGLKCYKCIIPLFKSKKSLLLDFDSSSNVSEDLVDEPVLKCPFYALSTQLPNFICRFEEELENSLQANSQDGYLSDVRDGKVWKDARTMYGSSFFSPENNELRIGLILHFDGFGGERSRNGSSYSSGVLSFSIANLPVHLRYNPGNLLVVALSPGPKESTCNELQHLLEAVVDDLIHLYNEGIHVKTPKLPEGRLCQVLLLANSCDHPALCRVCGFGDHSHLTWFCTWCKVPRGELRSIDGLTGVWLQRTGNEHKLHSSHYKKAEPGPEPHQREGLFKKNGARYYSISRIPYFDAVRMSILDPMHNILLGLCKSHWRDSWINRKVLRERTARKVRELDQIHDYLSKFKMPSWVGRLPNQVGYPAGGSLSADEYKALVLVYCPLIIPLIWREWQPLAQAEWIKAREKWDANSCDPNKSPGEEPRVRMHADDATNFLKLATALKIILGRKIRLDDLERAEMLLKEYLEGYCVIHPLDVKPNHHWVSHIFDQIRDFGPVYGFWTFTSERLNKILKSFSTNNHNGGEIETSFLRAFCKNTTLRYMLRSLVSSRPELDCGLSELSKAMLREDTDSRGTVASINAAVQEVEDQAQELSVEFCLGPPLKDKRTLDIELQIELIEYYNKTIPAAKVCSPTSLDPDGNYLVTHAEFYTYLTKDGRRITPSKSALRAPNSIIQMEFENRLHVGQVISIFSHRQLDSVSTHVHVRWFCPYDEVSTEEWDPYPELEVLFWKFNDHLRPGEPGPPALISPGAIKSQAARATVMTRPPRLSDATDDGQNSTPVWATIGLSRENIVF